MEEENKFYLPGLEYVTYGKFTPVQSKEFESQGATLYDYKTNEKAENQTPDSKTGFYWNPRALKFANNSEYENAVALKKRLDNMSQDELRDLMSEYPDDNEISDKYMQKVFPSLTANEALDWNNFNSRLGRFENYRTNLRAADRQVGNGYGGLEYLKLAGWLGAGAATAMGGAFIMPELLGAANLYSGIHGIKNGVKNAEEFWNALNRKDYEGAFWNGLFTVGNGLETAFPLYTLAESALPLAENIYNNREAISDFFRFYKNRNLKFGVNEETGDFGWFKDLPEGYTETPSKGTFHLNGETNGGAEGDILFFGSEETGYKPLLYSSTANSPKNSQLVFAQSGKNSDNTYYWMRMNNEGRTTLARSETAEPPQRFDKEDVKSFWIGADKMQKPGTYASGDAGTLPYGNEIMEAYNEEGWLGAIKKAISKQPIANPEYIMYRYGLSPDSYSAIIRQAQREGKLLRWGEGFTEWNDFGIDNKHIYDAFQEWKKGTKTFEEYESIFNNWVDEFGGKHLGYIIEDGKKVPVHYHPYILKEKKGGKLIPRHTFNTP